MPWMTSCTTYSSKAHTSLHTIKFPGGVTAWLYRIAANAIADHYRSRKPWDDLAASEPDHVAELAACLRPLIADLPETYRSALVEYKKNKSPFY
jgi:RNA polymerase sigma-70 factor (ECF subfamily)